MAALGRKKTGPEEQNDVMCLYSKKTANLVSFFKLCDYITLILLKKRGFVDLSDRNAQDETVSHLVRQNLHSQNAKPRQY